MTEEEIRKVEILSKLLSYFLTDTPSYSIWNDFLYFEDDWNEIINFIRENRTEAYIYCEPSDIFHTVLSIYNENSIC